MGRMKEKEGLQLIVTTVIAVLGSFAALGFFVSWQLSPLSKDIEHLKVGQAKIESRMDGIESRMDGIESRMDGIESRMDGIDIKMDDIKSKLDQLLANSKPN